MGSGNERVTVQRIVDMAQRFHAAVNPPWPWNADDMAEMVATMIDRDDCFVTTTDGGFLLALIQPNPMSRDWLIAKEFLWWAEDNSGPRLLRQFRAWAKRRGADEIQYSCPAGNKRVQRLYGRIGQPTETVYSEYSACASQQL